MSPRDAIQIAVAAQRWSAAYTRRRAATAAQRLAKQAYSALPKRLSRNDAEILERLEAHAREARTGAAVADARRQERAAARALDKLCSKSRGEHDDADVIDTPARLAAPPRRLPAPAADATDIVS